MIIFITIVTMHASTYFLWEISLNGSGEKVKSVKRHKAKLNLEGGEATLVIKGTAAVG
jgi:hypothetical protein